MFCLKVRSPSESANIQDLARNATKWCYCKSYAYNDWDELHRSDVWRRMKRPCTVGPDENIAQNIKLENKRDIQRKILTDRPKTVGSRLYLRGLEESYKNRKTDREQQLIPLQQKQAGKSNGKEKEKISIDVNSKVFKLAHGLVKTPNIRRFHGNDDNSTSEESVSDDDYNDNNGDDELSNSRRYKLNSKNFGGGYLSPERMNLEARRASRGNEDMAGLFRLAIERQRRLSYVTSDEYAEWALKMGLTHDNNNDHLDNEVDEGEINKDKDCDQRNQLKNDRETSEMSTSGTEWDQGGRKQGSKSKVEKLSAVQNVDFTNHVARMHSKTNEEKRLPNQSNGDKLEKINLTERTTRIREPRKGVELKNSSRNKFDAKMQNDLNRKEKRENPRENKLVTHDTQRLGDERQSQDSTSQDEQSEQTTDEISSGTTKSGNIGTSIEPTTDSSEKQLSTQDICQNVTELTLKELKRINEDPNLFSSDDDDDDTDEADDTEINEKDKAKEAAEAAELAEKEMKMKKELEAIHRRLQVSSFESKKFKLKIYVKPQLRYKTERMYLLRRKNLLHRQIALASQDMAGVDAMIPGSENRFTLQVLSFRLLYWTCSIIICRM